MSQRKLSQVLYFFLSVSLLIVPTGCTTDKPKSGDASPESTKLVTVVNFPVAALLKSATDGEVEILFPTADETSGLPSDAQLDKMQNGAMIVVGGGHQAGWVDIVSIPESIKFNLRHSVINQLITVQNLGSHRHGPTGAHSHPGVVSETWLAPSLFQLQITALINQLKKQELIDQTSADKAISKCDQLLKPEIEKITALKRKQNEKWLVDHAGCEYLCRQLNISPTIVELNIAFESDPAALKKELAQWKKNNPSTGVLLTQQPAEGVKALLKELGMETVQIDLINDAGKIEEAGKLGAESYLKRLRQNIANLEKFYKN